MSAQPSPATAPVRVVGRYALCREIAAGGMATVHLARLIADTGFARTVAIKRLLPQLAKDAEFATMFLQEAQLAARIRHPNVVPTLDVVSTAGELFLVLEYVHGESLATLLRLARKSGERVPQTILVSVISSALQGLHAAHEANSEIGEPLNLVHRDVSPQNVLVDVDGVSRVIDFGVAKAMTSAHTTNAGQMKGKIKYMAPEQILSLPVSRRTDIFATGILLWEGLTGRRLFDADNEAAVLHAVLNREIPAPSRVARDIDGRLDSVVMRALQREPEKRFASAGEMSAALEAALSPATQRDVGDWVKRVARDRLVRRRAQLAEVERIVSLETVALPTDQGGAEAGVGDDASGSGLHGHLGSGSSSGSQSQLHSGSAMSALSVSAPQTGTVAQTKKRSLVVPISIAVGIGIAAGVVVFSMQGIPTSVPTSGLPEDGAKPPTVDAANAVGGPKLTSVEADGAPTNIASEPSSVPNRDPDVDAAKGAKASVDGQLAGAPSASGGAPTPPVTAKGSPSQPTAAKPPPTTVRPVESLYSRD